MTGTQSLVGFGGVGLVAANFWFGGQRSQVSAGLFGSGDPGVAHTALLTLGGEMLLVVVVTVLAGISDAWAGVMAAVIVGLWILWAMHHYGKQSSPTTQPRQGGAA